MMEKVLTWITDGSGTKWVEVPQPKRKKAPPEPSV